jgi:polyribonucleotide nucleotidyltransferase
MDAGVPLKTPVAGIAMGLIKEDDGVAVLSDILGDEDHLGDMDFKVAGTERGVTALQMDIKITSITQAIMKTALEQAQQGRMHILGEMAKTIESSRQAVSEKAPRITVIHIAKDKIREVIGSGGKVIREICEVTGAKIDIEDDGTVYISCNDYKGAERAKAAVEAIAEDVQVGRIYDGKIISIKDFGAFVELAPGQDGLCHISELDDTYVKNVNDVVQIGQRLRVKVINVDDQGRVKLSRKAVLRDEAEGKES